MSDAEKIIGMLESVYRCPMPGCTHGKVRLTLSRDGEFFYQCGSCGASWAQDGTPMVRQSEAVADDD